MRFLIYSLNKLYGECLSISLASVKGVLFVKHVWTIQDAINAAHAEDITSVLVDVSD